ncbi:hypothetical protein SDC9_183171 [bioreactor metagenome]|uniref:Uncharacterized protein n=1 Tax=bioreactor metagenome TaxID=1076179 RepID=A0A645HJ50_9ZZZZ
MSEISHMMEHLIEEIPTSFSVMNRPRDFDSRNASFEKLIFGQQKTINIICCRQHYFDSNELILLQNYRQRVGESGNLDNLREIIFAKDNCLAKFRDVIIPDKLAEIEKQIQNMEAKLKPLSE